MTYKLTPIAISVHNESDNPIFGESATHVCLEDEAAGPFIILKQCNDDSKNGEVRVDIIELELIVQAAKQLIEGWPK